MNLRPAQYADHPPKGDPEGPQNPHHPHSTTRRSPIDKATSLSRRTQPTQEAGDLLRYTHGVPAVTRPIPAVQDVGSYLDVRVRQSQLEGLRTQGARDARPTAGREGCGGDSRASRRGAGCSCCGIRERRGVGGSRPGINVGWVHSDFNGLRRRPRALRRENEQLGQPPHGQLESVLPVPPRPGSQRCVLLMPRLRRPRPQCC
jgi:hypothetical protein